MGIHDGAGDVQYQVGRKMALGEAEYDRIYGYLLVEAEILDSHNYDAWLALWEPTEACYWVPAAGGDGVGTTPAVSLILDDYLRLEERVYRLLHEGAHSQEPRSETARVIGAPLISRLGEDRYEARVPFTLAEVRRQRQTIYAGRTAYVLSCRPDGQVRMLEKSVRLIGRGLSIGNLTFLL